MIRYVMVNDCGCCEDNEIFFESDQHAEEAVQKIGLKNGAMLVDANGIEHHGLDSFYGIRRADVQETRGKLQILSDLILKNAE